MKEFLRNESARLKSMEFFVQVIVESWHLLMEASVYVLFGMVAAGLLRVFLNPNSVAKHLGRGRFTSVFKAAFLGIPVPLCSCGVLPAAVSLKKQGANSGATTAFLIATPESGVDSIAITYALLGPIMAVIRPVAAFLTATAAGIAENLLDRKSQGRFPVVDLSCPVDSCCDGKECSPEEHMRHHGFFQKIGFGLKYAFSEVWGDMAGWFLVGMLLAGIITVLIPDRLFTAYLGSGIYSMLIMLLISTPLYICATASTPIAAAMILKGVSPGAALVFLLAGPATNITSLTVLLGVLGKRATVIYMCTIAISAICFGLAVDRIYLFLGTSLKATVIQGSEMVPAWIQFAGAVLLLLLSVKPVWRTIKGAFTRKQQEVSGSKSSPPSEAFPAVGEEKDRSQGVSCSVSG